MLFSSYSVEFQCDKLGIKIRVVLKDGLPRELVDVVETVDLNCRHVVKFILSNEGQQNICLKRCDHLKSDGFNLTFDPTVIRPGNRFFIVFPTNSCYLVVTERAYSWIKWPGRLIF